MTASQVKRFDTADFSSSKAEETPEGYLKADCIATRTGVFLYMEPDGTLRRELRHPNEVFSADSLASLSMLPMTLEHPPEALVDKTNVKRLQVGHTAEKATVDSPYIRVKLLVTDEKAVQAVKNGKEQLSLGYTAIPVKESGTYEGERYDYRQTDIRYNHLAIVDVARAGPRARIKLDSLSSGDAVAVTDEHEDIPSMTTEKLSTITLDSINYQAAPEVINAYSKAKARIDELEKSSATLDAEKAAAVKEKDTLQAKVDSLTEEIKKVKEEAAKRSDEDFMNAVKERSALLDAAQKLMSKDEFAKADSMKNAELKKAVLLAHSPELKLDGKSEDYINARFDCVLELISELKNDAAAIQRAASTSMPLETKTDSQKAMVDGLVNAWKPKA